MAVEPKGIVETARTETTGQMLSYFKMMAVLECFSRSDKALTVLQISKKIDLPRTTVHRLVSTLKTLGLLEQDPVDVLAADVGVRLGLAGRQRQLVVGRADPGRAGGHRTEQAGAV